MKQALLATAPLVCIFISLCLGQTIISPLTAFTVISEQAFPSGWLKPTTAINETLIWQLRLPRTLLAGLSGASLSVVGAVMQSLVRNPMADPYLLGVSSGASLGAILVIVYPIRFLAI